MLKFEIYCLVWPSSFLQYIQFEDDISSESIWGRTLAWFLFNVSSSNTKHVVYDPCARVFGVLRKRCIGY